ncbi:xanthine dehydrogenase family protein molybdopterin-binding subunit [Rhodocytophaga rosea]|uniref:Xanthine dehydrogenase family protein molybdopterin-binding subunit n=1 Tax=Rhodocytophaga rosea TaxID=2704465 RepID=A0A6C0GH65_9BACT|nr:molybdopterin cofactor-binding domain-containing protein [Rhodocytophaga rosea]QHT67279.1 xanthine dehydrogenase family protein molybdopterin-binding subunit [Rhodocytophaga rosea]
MQPIEKTINRRSFLKVSALAGGGMMLSFSWLAGCNPSTPEEVATLPKEWFELNSYIKIADNGAITLMAPNPEFGSNVKTSLPMMLAEELDVDWKNVTVEQADFFPERFERQFTGGSQAMRAAWKPLRTAGATARHMLIEAAAQTWQVPAGEITTENGILHHKGSSKKASYGEMTSKAAGLEVPKEVPFKNSKDYKIIGNSKRNVEGLNIVTGKPLFTMDYKKEGMLIAMMVHPPAFGLKVKSVDDKAAKAMPGIKDVFIIKTLADDYERNGFDTTSFTELVVVVGNTTWEVMNAKKALKVEWEKIADTTIAVAGRGGKQTVTIPAGLESSEGHQAKMAEMAKKPGKELRKDGNPEVAFKKAAKVIERTYTAPFLAHNCMEPVNCYAHVTADKAELIGPIQAPEFIMQALTARLGLPKEKIHIKLARMGGGFGQRAYGHHLVEAAAISQKLNAPVKLMYTREDDMTYGIYRPTYTATYKAALDENNNLIAYQVKAGGIPEGPLGFSQNRFPAGAVDNYLAEEWVLNSNITIGAFRAPRSNFLGGAEQSFLDEVAELAGKDPIEFRLELLERAKKNPVGKDNDYDPDRYAGVLKLVRDKSNWKKDTKDVHRGVSAYFCHNTYVAEVIDLSMKEDKPIVEKVYAAVDCGIVVNPDAAANMGEGAIIDGIGNALYGEMTFKEGVPQKNNFHTYRMIRHSEAPKAIEVHFVKSEVEPTGLGEPLFPPIFGALANAIYKATGKREYTQPFLQGKGPLV